MCAGFYARSWTISENLPFSKKKTITYNNSRPIEVEAFLSKINNLTDEFENMSTTDSTSGINCKYYDVNELSEFTFRSKNLSLFHLNIASLSLHHVELKLLLNQLGINFNIIGITETKYSSLNPPSNCHIEGYDIVHTASDSNKGGALLYISNKWQYTCRTDLNRITHKGKELESIFLEISQPNNKNIIIGCIYRHPNMSIDDIIIGKNFIQK